MIGKFNILNFISGVNGVSFNACTLGCLTSMRCFSYSGLSLLFTDNFEHVSRSFNLLFFSSIILRKKFCTLGVSGEFCLDQD